MIFIAWKHIAKKWVSVRAAERSFGLNGMDTNICCFRESERTRYLQKDISPDGHDHSDCYAREEKMPKNWSDPKTVSSRYSGQGSRMGAKSDPKNTRQWRVLFTNRCTHRIRARMGWKGQARVGGDWEWIWNHFDSSTGDRWGWRYLCSKAMLGQVSRDWGSGKEHTESCTGAPRCHCLTWDFFLCRRILHEEMEKWKI